MKYPTESFKYKYKDMTAKENELLKRIQKRIDWLNKRIYSDSKDKADLSYDRAELHALEWGITIIEKYLGVALEVEPPCRHIYHLLNKTKIYCIKCLLKKEL